MRSERLQQQLLTQLRQDVLLSWPTAQELSPGAIKARFPSRTRLIAGWNLRACMREHPNDLLIVVDDDFPWSLPLVALPTAPNAITFPHVEADGKICLTPSSASYSLPVGRSHVESLVTDAEDVLRLGRTHANDDDFLIEAHSYWSLLGSSKAQVWITCRGPTGHELWNGVRTGEDWVVGPEKAALEAWITASGRAQSHVEPCVVLRLANPLYPSLYPRTASDVLKLARSLDAQNVVDRAMRKWTGKRPLPFLLVFSHAGNDVWLGGLLASPFGVKLPGARGTGVPGFRRNGKINQQAVALVPGDFSHLRAIPVHRQYLTARTTGAVPPRLSDSHVVIAGCGAIGGELAVQLAKAGVGELTLLDAETFDWRNVGRHILDGAAVGMNKAKALQGFICRSFPEAKVKGHPIRWEDLKDPQREAVQNADLIIAVTGEVAGNLHLDSLVADGEMPATLFGFTEAFAVAGHAILQLNGSGRLRALTDEFGVLREPVVHLAGPQTLPQEPSCGAFYQPYSSLSALATIGLIGELAIDALLGRVTVSSHRVWVGSTGAFGRQRARDDRRLAPSSQQCGRQQALLLSSSTGTMKFTFRETTYAFGAGCLASFDARRQRSRLSRETGGQLFGRFKTDHILIERATETVGGSVRSRFGFWPDRSAEQADIVALYTEGLHYLGDWHTHPEGEPIPSREDKEKIMGIFRESRHDLRGMFLVIVGLFEFPAGLYVGAVSDGKIEVMVLEPSGGPS